MLDVIRSLFEHQEWADDTLLNAAGAQGATRDDPELRRTLHHIFDVQRAFVTMIRNKPLDPQNQPVIPESWSEFQTLFASSHRELRELTQTLTEPDLSRMFTMPRVGWTVSIGDALIQVAMHGQNHRGQCLTRMRLLGVQPPTLDYILWVVAHRSTDAILR